MEVCVTVYIMIIPLNRHVQGGGGGGGNLDKLVGQEKAKNKIILCGSFYV